MSFIQVVLAALVLLGPLIAIHEFGHFWVARQLGVKVLTYSIGFGPALLKRRGRDGVQYQVALIPLGGYVRMADEREGEVAEEDLPFAFNRQPVWKRMAIVAAGPLINLLFAVLLFWVLYLPKTEAINTRIWQVNANTPAAVAGLKAGDLITAIDGKATPTMEQLHFDLLGRMGESGHIQVTVERDDQKISYDLPIHRFTHVIGSSPYAELGFSPYRPQIAPIIGQVEPGSVAAKAGLKVGDRIAMLDGKPVTDWIAMTDVVYGHPEQPLSAVIERQGQQMPMTLTPASRKDDLGTKIGLLGIRPQIVDGQKFPIPAAYKQVIDLDPVTALDYAVQKGWQFSALTMTSFGKMLQGDVSLDNIRGPITTARMAERSAEIGFWAFISYMAVMSLSLGVLNLLPIPVLDGGHLLYYAAEAIAGRPLSEGFQQAGLRLGLMMLLALMGLALFNDVSSLF